MVGESVGVNVGANVGGNVGGLEGVAVVSIGIGARVGILEGAIEGDCVGLRDGIDVRPIGAFVGERDGAFVVAVNEYDVHCIFVSAAVGPQLEVPVA